MVTINELFKAGFDWDNLIIDEEEYEQLSADLVIDYLKKNSPEERQKLALCWNFDNSKQVIRWIVSQPDTDKGTVLFLYWHMNPAYYKQFASRAECEQKASWAVEEYDIIALTEKNYCSDFYRNQSYAFDPENDFYNSGYDWTKEYEENEGTGKIPKEMFSSLEGEILENPHWEEGIPAAVLDIMDKLGEAVEE